MPVIQPNVKMNWKLVQILQLIIGIELLLPSVVDGRVAGKVGYTSNYHKGEYRMSAWSNQLSELQTFAPYSTGRSTTGINEQIIWVSIGMATAIAVLITLALCYILYEECKKRREYYVNV